MLLLFVALTAIAIIMMGTSTAAYNAGNGEASIGPFMLAVVFGVAAYFVWGVL